MLGLVSANVAVAAKVNLIGWWTLDEGTGTIASDSSGRGNDGTLGGNPQWVTGIFGGALELDGDDDYVAIDSIADDLTDNDFTVCAWIKTTQTGDGNVIGSNSGGGHDFVFGVDGGNLLVEADNLNTYPPAINDNQWHFIAYVRDGTTAYAYTDGVLVGTETPTANPSTQTRWSIGQEWDSSDSSDPSDEFDGTVDEVRFYDGPLSAEHILDLFNGIEPTFLKAMDPDPADGATLEATWTGLGWGSGDTAVSHDVYFSDNFADVNDGTGDAFRGNTADTFLFAGFEGYPYPDGLVPGTSYYWRIDEVEADGTTKYRGSVWSFTVPPYIAYNPDPPEGAKFIDPDVTLNWSPGFGAKLHYIQFGDNFDDVNNAAVGAPSPTTTFTPGTLELGKTYYWRVDESNPPAPAVKGDVWSFITLPVIAIADESLVGWWTLDEGMGMTAVDWSGYGGHGTFVGSPQWVDGYDGGALEFSRTGQYINCGPAAAQEVTGDFTIAAWVKLAPNNAGRYAGIAGKLVRVGGADYMGFSIVRHDSNVFRLWVADGDSAQINGRASSDVIYTDTSWHHVTGVREGRTNALYVDGVRQRETTTTDFVPSKQFAHIGRQYSHLDDRYFNGLIDDVRIYNRTLTQAEIMLVMRGNLLLAWDASPANGSLAAINVAATLKWSAGEGASQHDVYYGADRDAVAGADVSDTTGVYRGRQNATSYTPPEGVEMNSGPHYWRIDEIANDGTIVEGSVWSFSVADYILVEDFESYNDIESGQPGSNLVYETWLDGYGTTTNGSAMGYTVAFQPTMETGTVHGGQQSAPLEYNNTTAAFSEAARTLASQNWTDNGIQTLLLWFHGDPTNTPGQLYVKINGVQVNYTGASANLARPLWQPWPIDLASVGTNLQSVTSLAIGVEGFGATGTLLLDDIRLYP